MATRLQDTVAVIQSPTSALFYMGQACLNERAQRRYDADDNVQVDVKFTRPYNLVSLADLRSVVRCTRPSTKEYVSPHKKVFGIPSLYICMYDLFVVGSSGDRHAVFSLQEDVFAERPHGA